MILSESMHGWNSLSLPTIPTACFTCIIVRWSVTTKLRKVWQKTIYLTQISTTGRRGRLAKIVWILKIYARRRPSISGSQDCSLPQAFSQRGEWQSERTTNGDCDRQGNGMKGLFFCLAIAIFACPDLARFRWTLGWRSLASLTWLLQISLEFK